MEESIVINRKISPMDQKPEKSPKKHTKKNILLGLNLAPIIEGEQTILPNPQKKPKTKGTFRAEIHYPEGSHYIGEIGKAMKRHGNGTMKWKSGALYKGEFKDDKCHGKGFYKEKELSYNGFFIDNLPDGHGDLSIGDYLYEGKFFDGLKCGKGREVMPNGNVYTGEFYDGRRMGDGILKNKEGEELISGEFNEDSGDMRGFEIKEIFYPKTDEFGNLLKEQDKEETEEPKEDLTKTAVLDSKYMGEIDSKNMKNGQGVKKFSEDSIYEKYEGQWFKNKFHRYGKLFYKNGEKYEGEFNSGLFHGNGVFSYGDGRVYSGHWQYGQRNGEGCLETEDYELKGEFKNGKLEGYGIESKKNGDIYEGEFKNGVKNGIGILKFKDGVYLGKWLHGAKNGFFIALEGQELSFRIYNNDKISKFVNKDCFVNEKQKLYFKEILLKILDHSSKKDPFNLENKKFEKTEFSQIKQLENVKIATNHNFTFQNFSRFLGQIQNKRMNGLGNFWYETGMEIEGSWFLDLFHGKSGNSVEYPNHDRFEGGYHLGLKHGKFIEYYQGVSFSGEYYYGVRKGKGEMKINEKTVKGHFIHNKIHSDLIFLDEKRNKLYTIQGCDINKNDISELKEKILEKDEIVEILGNDFSAYAETVYSRTLFHSDSHKSEIKFKDGSVYNGETLIGMRHGYGTITWRNNQTYSGDWEYDFPSGYGKLDFGNGDRYIGNFWKGKTSGRGVLVYKDGRRVDAIWENDEILEMVSFSWGGGNLERVEGGQKVVVRFKNSDRFEGEFGGEGNYYSDETGDVVRVRMHSSGEFEKVGSRRG